MQVSTQRSKHNLGIESAPHIKASMTTTATMVYVVIALLPGFVCANYFYGFGVLWQFGITLGTAIVCELLVCLLRRRSVSRQMRDYAWLVTALLLSLTLPPLMPWYYTVAACAFAILVAKHCFGGLGMNIFNPAMTGFVFLMISAPGIFFTTWVTPGYNSHRIATLETTYGIIFELKDSDIMRTQLKLENADFDRISGATYLESIKTARKSGASEAMEPINFEHRNYHPYVVMGAAYLLGGLLLLSVRVILFQVPFFFLGTVALCGFAWNHLDPNASVNALEHLLFGGTMLAAFFILTDPVTSAGTARGRILFCVLCGLLVVMIRVEGSYSDSVAFSVLLVNACAPMIDVITKRRPFGAGYIKGGLQ